MIRILFRQISNQKHFLYSEAIRTCSRIERQAVLYDARVLKALLSLFLLVTTCVCSFAQTLSPLASSPNWSKLDKYQGTITRQQFLDLLDRVYAPNNCWKEWIAVTPNGAQIVTRTGRSPFILRFAPDQQKACPVLHAWKSRSDLPPQRTTSQPLAGLRITLDPGHLGGKWAAMEERWFRVAGGTPVKEGDMTLRVAKILAPRLRTLGATVTMTRSHPGPTTSLRPQNFRTLAASELQMKGKTTTAHAIRKESERLFYRTAEIKNRARLVNEKFRPDLVLCLHFNAEAWGKETHPQLSPKNHLHLLVNGAVSSEELSREDQRFDLLLKLLNRSSSEEIPLANAVANSLAVTTSLPPYVYQSHNAIRISPYVWARNLLATRLFQCPVIFVEAYVMNNPEVVARVQAGDYSGVKRLRGMSKKQSIYREYADGIVQGLLQYYSSR